MPEVTITHPILQELDADDVQVLFEGKAALREGKLVCAESYDVFVWRRLSLLDSELRIQDYSDTFKLVKFRSPELQLYVEALVPAYSVLMGEQSLLYDVLDFLRRTDPEASEQWMAAMPEIDWILKAKRYLRERRRLQELSDLVNELRRQLHPGEVH